MKEDFSPPPEKVLQAEKEIEEGTVDEYLWSLAKGAGVDQLDIEGHYILLRVGQLNEEEYKNRFRYKLERKVRENRKLILVCLVVLILIAGIIVF